MSRHLYSEELHRFLRRRRTVFVFPRSVFCFSLWQPFTGQSSISFSFGTCHLFFFWCHIWHSAHELSTPILSEHPCFPKSDEQLLFFFSLLPIGLFRSRNDIGRLSKLACAWRLWRITRSTCTHRRASITEWRVTFRGSLLRAHSWPKWRCALQVLKEGICLTCWHLMAVVGKEKISPVHNVASSCTQ